MNKSKLPLLIPVDSYRQMMAYVELAKGEITWFFDVDFDTTQQAFVVGKVYLVPQQAGAGSVEMEEPDVANFLLSLIDEGVDQLPRGWGHSHVNMAAFFSGTDENTIAELDTGSFLVALVMNKREEYQATVRFNYPDFNYRMDLELEVRFNMKESTDEFRAEVDEKVKDIVYTTPAPKTKFRSPEQLGSGGGAHRGLHSYTDNDYYDYFDDINNPNPDICVSCWVLKENHKFDPKACKKPEFVPIQTAVDMEWEDSRLNG